MNKVSKRAWIVLVAGAVILAGLLVFVVRYMTSAVDWVTFPGSPHLYSGINPDTGVVLDRNGEKLLDSTNGRTYSEDLSVRLSTIHLLGDRYGYIEAPLLGHFTDNMIDYNPITGLKQNGEEIRTAELSLSSAAQKAALNALDGRKGTVGVYNYKTGEILCAVTTPTYDPDNVPDIANDTTGAYEGVYVNRFFRSSYTPGSIFKTLTTAAALEQIEGVEEMTFYCEGETIVGGELVTCAGIHGYQNLAQALRNSCNVAYADISVMLGADTLDQYVEMVGIREHLFFDGITTAAGSFDLTGASQGSLAWAGIGQYTDLVNPCQYMVFMGMLANGGSAAQPYLMQTITSGDSVKYESETVMLVSGLQRETAATVAQMMRDNVIYGYGEWMFPDVSVCAKSGTAETVEGKANNALFAGFVQDEAYPLAFIVVVEEGGSGASAAAPIASEVLAACIADMDRENS